MASLIDLTEAAVDLASRPLNHALGYADWLRFDPAQEVETVDLIANSAWERVEQRIPNRYVPRAFTAIIRADMADELVTLPLTPITVTTVELFDIDTGTYTAQSPLKAGPEASSVFLPDCGIWRLIGVAGPTPAIGAPRAVEQAVFRLVAFAYENRGDVGHDFQMEGAFIGSGAADLLRQYVRI